MWPLDWPRAAWSPQRSGSVPHLLHYRVKEHTAEKGSLVRLCNRRKGENMKYLNPISDTQLKYF